MDRKKFVALFSTSILGAAFLKVNPMKIFTSKNSFKNDSEVKVKINPHAVNREKSGKKNG